MIFQASISQSYKRSLATKYFEGHCSHPSTHYFINGFSRKNAKFSFYINNNDPNKLTALNINGQDRIQLVARGNDCYTYSDTARINRFGVLLRAKSATECEIKEYILPMDLVPCQGGVTYTKFEDRFRFKSIDNNYYTYSSIGRDARRAGINGKIVENWFCSVGVDSAQQVSSYFNDQFAELILACPLKIYDFRYITYFDEEFFGKIKIGLNSFPAGINPSAFTPNKFLKRVTHDGLPGYHFDVDQAGDKGTLYYSLSAHKLALTRSFVNQFYISNPGAFDGTNLATIAFRTDHNPSVTPAVNLRKYSYNIKIDKVLDRIRIQMDRVNSANGTVTPATLTIEIPIEVAGDWIHFGFSVGIAPLFHGQTTGTSSLYIKVYEELFGWHNDKTYRDSSDYSWIAPTQTSFTDTSDDSEIIKFQLNVYDDAAKTIKNPNNIFGLRYISRASVLGAFPPTRLGVALGENNEKKCFFKGLLPFECNAFAFLKNMNDVQPQYLLDGFYKERVTCPGTEKCSYCMLDNLCMVPKDGYNRQLRLTPNPSYIDPLVLASAFEGASEAAEKQREGFVVFLDNQGNKYWVRCPDSCNFFRGK